MINANVKVSRKFINQVYRQYVKDTTETQIYFGGSSSGKSYFLAQRCVLDLLEGKRNYLICRKVGKYVGKSVWLEIENIINQWNIKGLFNFNKSERVITCKNGKQAIFTGLDEPQKLKSIRAQVGPITDIWIEEATEAERTDLKELEKRQRGGNDDTPKRITLSFNPILKSHWIYKDFFERIAWADDQKEYRSENLLIVKTTYLDNQFLTKQDKDRLENETDPYYRDVYTLGKWGVLGNVIFTKWEVRDLTEILDQLTNRRHGLDFGYGADPAALPATHYDEKFDTIYIYDELYQNGLTNDELAADIIRLIGSDPVACDNAEPKSIAELRKYGVTAYPCKKGKDSVDAGIKWLQQRKIIVDSRCINARNEFGAYKWREDKDGNVLPIPVDKNNHLIDALRYAYEDLIGGASWYVS